jgi:hypothetical protein
MRLLSQRPILGLVTLLCPVPSTASRSVQSWRAARAKLGLRIALLLLLADSAFVCRFGGLALSTRMSSPLPPAPFLPLFPPPLLPHPPLNNPLQSPRANGLKRNRFGGKPMHQLFSPRGHICDILLQPCMYYVALLRAVAVEVGGCCLATPPALSACGAVVGVECESRSLAQPHSLPVSASLNFLQRFLQPRRLQRMCCVCVCVCECVCVFPPGCRGRFWKGNHSDLRNARFIIFHSSTC